MASFIPINSISIDITDAINKRDENCKCDHFSIRGYVAEMRKKDWKLCWPFPVLDSDKPPILPPFEVGKFKCWRCQDVRQEKAGADIHKDDQTDLNCHSTECKSDPNCSNAPLKSGNQQDPVPNTHVREKFDLNTNLSSLDSCLPISNEKEKEAGVALNRITGIEVGLEDDLNHQETSVPSPKSYPGLAHEMHTANNGCEGNGFSYVPPASSVEFQEKGSADICNGGTSSADNKGQKDLVKACSVLGEGTTVFEADNKHDPTSRPPLELAVCNQAMPAGSTDNMDENDDNMIEDDLQDHHLENSTSLSRRRPRKVRLMTDLLSDNGELRTEQIAIRESPSNGNSNAAAVSQAPSIFPGKVDIQGDLTLTNTGQSRKRKSLQDEVWRPPSISFQRAEVEVQNLERGAITADTAFDTRSNSKDVIAGMGLQDAVKGHWTKPENERSHIMGKKKNKKNQVVDNYLIPEPQQGQQRKKEAAMDTADKAYASKTVSSRIAPRVLTGKRMDTFPSHALRIENELNLSKEKGKKLQTDSLSSQKNDMLIGHTFAYSGKNIRSSMPVDVPNPSVQGVMNGKGLDDGLHLSLDSYLTANFNKKCIHQTENRFPFSLPFQEGTSKVPQFSRKDNETNVFRGPNISSRHTPNSISGKGIHFEEMTVAGNREKTVEAAEQLGVMKRYGERKAEVSEQGTVDDIPMEIVELLAKNQYERCLPDVENRCSTLEKSSVRRKAQMTAGTTGYGKGEMSFLKECQKEKPQGKHKKSNMMTRGENVKPSKRNSAHYFSPFDGNNSGPNNLYPPQSPYGFEVSQSQKRPSSGFHFSPMVSSQLGSAKKCKLTGSLEERAPSNAAWQGLGGCSLHKNILLQQNDWASLTSNHVSIGHVPQKVVSQPTNINVDITSLRSGALHKQNMKRDIDLNYINMNAAGLEKHSRNTGTGAFSRMNGDYAFPCKHNGMEPHQNLRGSLDFYSNETIPAMHLLSLMDAGMQTQTPFNVGASAQMLKRPSYPGDCNTKLEIGSSKAHDTLKRQPHDYYSRSFLSDKPHGCFIGSPTFGASASTQPDKKLVRATGFNGESPTKLGKKEKMKSSNSTLQNVVSNQFSLPPRLEMETLLQRKLDAHGTQATPEPLKVISGNSCVLNRNPADFTIPETGNVYMIRGEDLTFEKGIPKNKSRFPAPDGHKQQRNSKGAKMKEHSKH